MDKHNRNRTVPLIIQVPEGEYCDACYYLEEIAYCNLFCRTLKCKVNKRIKCKECKDKITERNEGVKMKPHKCPVCGGDGKRYYYTMDMLVGKSGDKLITMKCLTCKGTGILWEPNSRKKQKKNKGV